tara:strand:- start:806 stop:1567 length:762 start_codon:yes stop_codon:yes gene_type:complete
MGFWNKVADFAGQAIKTYGDMNEEFKKQKHMMANYSPERLKTESLNHSNSKPRKLAAKQLLKDRLVNQSAPLSAYKPKNEKKRFSNNVAFRNGDDPKIKTAIILSAPGQVEERVGRPAAGQTGKTLQTAINKLNQSNPKDFPSNNLDDYTILNAVEDVHYKAKTGRTEGKDNEILDPSNMKRINAILTEADNVVALGEKAQLAVNKSSFNGNIFKGKHPSMQALNKKYKSDKQTPSERSQDRVEQWTKELDKS